MAYPDITLLTDICEILEISEKELLSASEDIEGRRAEQLARKYLRLARNYRLIQYIIFGLTAIVCFIVNLAVQHTLSWFFIVLCSELLCASLTLLPALMPEGKRRLGCLGGFTGTLLILLAVCCIYTGGDWFFVAVVSVLFGLGVVFLPFVLKSVLPPELLKVKKSLYLGTETLLLLLLLLVCSIHTGGDWLLTAVIWTVFGLAVVFLPVVLRELPLPESVNRHKALLYMGTETVLLLLGLMYQGWGNWFPNPGLSVALCCLVLPWGYLGVIRYLPASGWVKAALSAFWTGLWMWLGPWGIDRFVPGGIWYGNQGYRLLLPFDFTNWSDPNILSINVVVLVMIGFGLLGLVFLAVGLKRKHR